IELTDARGSHRRLEVEQVDGEGVLVRAEKTVYWATGTALTTPHGPLEVGPLPPLEQSMRVHEGEQIVLTRSLEPVPAVDAPPYRIGLTLAQAFADAEVGDRVSTPPYRIGLTLAQAFADAEVGDRVS
ncbi:pyruvate kinase, partial [Aquicoccus sp. SCR17]|nr:pyruvate kinase [Carideicomes alvinocaridis]